MSARGPGPGASCVPALQEANALIVPCRFYHNEKTGESTWEKPEALAWRQVPVERTEL